MATIIERVGKRIGDIFAGQDRYIPEYEQAEAARLTPGVPVTPPGTTLRGTTTGGIIVVGKPTTPTPSYSPGMSAEEHWAARRQQESQAKAEEERRKKAAEAAEREKIQQELRDIETRRKAEAKKFGDRKARELAAERLSDLRVRLAQEQAATRVTAFEKLVPKQKEKFETYIPEYKKPEVARPTLREWTGLITRYPKVEKAVRKGEELFHKYTYAEKELPFGLQPKPEYYYGTKFSPFYAHMWAGAKAAPILTGISEKHATVFGLTPSPKEEKFLETTYKVAEFLRPTVAEMPKMTFFSIAMRTGTYQEEEEAVIKFAKQRLKGAAEVVEVSKSTADDVADSLIKSKSKEGILKTISKWEKEIIKASGQKKEVAIQNLKNVLKSLKDRGVIKGFAVKETTGKVMLEGAIQKPSIEIIGVQPVQLSKLPMVESIVMLEEQVTQKVFAPSDIDVAFGINKRVGKEAVTIPRTEVILKPRTDVMVAPISMSKVLTGLDTRTKQKGVVLSSLLTGTTTIQRPVTRLAQPQMTSLITGQVTRQVPRQVTIQKPTFGWGFAPTPTPLKPAKGFGLLPPFWLGFPKKRKKEVRRREVGIIGRGFKYTPTLTAFGFDVYAPKVPARKVWTGFEVVRPIVGRKPKKRRIISLFGG